MLNSNSLYDQYRGKIKLISQTKKKSLIWGIIGGSGLIIPMIAIAIFAMCLTPLFIFGGNVLSEDTSNDIYYGVELGIGNFMLNGKGVLQYPLAYNGSINVSSGFGKRIHPITKKESNHTGIDLPCSLNDTVKAAEAGVVLFAGQDKIYGNLIIIRHQNGFKTLYGHLNKILILKGDEVSKGQEIGLAGTTGLSTGVHLHFEVHDENDAPVDPAPMLGMVAYIPDVLPDDLKYVEVDMVKLKNWLKVRDSVLVERDYLDAMITAAKDKNVNPLLLVAITGQEQSFVPKSSPNCYKIANNPFNIYHSWQDYNSDIWEASRIVVNTIINKSKDRPAAVNPIYWINKQYAEDKNWWIGVSKFFDVLQKNVLAKK